jgi:hypothetical protein
LAQEIYTRSGNDCWKILPRKMATEKVKVKNSKFKSVVYRLRRLMKALKDKTNREL